MENITSENEIQELLYQRKKLKKRQKGIRQHFNTEETISFKDIKNGEDTN